jgi:lysophospholipase L1-like esterase
MSIELALLGLILLAIVLALTLFIQAKYLIKHAIRLPEATGVRSSIANRKPSLLHIGESTVAGVGVDSIEQGLTFSILRYLTKINSKELDWEILGKNGAKVTDALALKTVIECPDILILTFGVNDTKGFTRKSEWIKNIILCVDRFSCSITKVYITGIPPMHKFPLLPNPLRYLLGMKAKLLDHSLKKVCKNKNWIYIQSNFNIKPSPMAKDGFHPNSVGYKLWGEFIAKKILESYSN